MDTELLRTFIEVSKTRHFGKAANNLFITQSAVSARIKLLESTVGVPLFDRVRNNIQLTPAGQRLVSYAEGIVHMWNRAVQQVAASDDGEVFLSVGAVPALWDIFLEDWLGRVCRGEPRIVVHADVYAPEAQLRMLRDGSLDLGFMFDMPSAEGLRTTAVANIPLLLVSSAPNVSVDQALAEGYVLVDWGTSFMSFHARNFSELIRPDIRVGLGRLAHGLLRQQGGAAYLAEPMVRDDLRGERLFLVENSPSMERQACAVYAEDNDRRETVEAAIHMAVLRHPN